MPVGIPIRLWVVAIAFDASRWPANSPLWQAPVFWNYVRHRRPCCGGCRASRPPGV